MLSELTSPDRKWIKWEIACCQGQQPIQNGRQTWIREKLTDCAQSIQEMELLVAKGNNQIQYGG